MVAEQAEEQKPEQAEEQATAGNTSGGGRWPKGHCPNPRGRAGKSKKPPSDDGLTLVERMSRVLTEEWSENDLRKLLKDDPAGYRRLMELARKADQGPGRDGGNGEPAPAPADESTARIVELARRCLEELGGKHR